mmetsp:Transcript_141669/g.394964  ORF Transcript_141669/g.394964 Transcript_141669/m.394964 type:complete len:206 (+) Transcript_141669:319-936(+)
MPQRGESLGGRRDAREAHQAHSAGSADHLLVHVGADHQYAASLRHQGNLLLGQHGPSPHDDALRQALCQDPDALQCTRGVQRHLHDGDTSLYERLSGSQRVLRLQSAQDGHDRARPQCPLPALFGLQQPARHGSKCCRLGLGLGHGPGLRLVLGPALGLGLEPRRATAREEPARGGDGQRDKEVVDRMQHHEDIEPRQADVGVKV